MKSIVAEPVGERMLSLCSNPPAPGVARQFGRFDLENDEIACQLILVRLAADAVAGDDDKVTARNRLSFCSLGDVSSFQSDRKKRANVLL